MKKFSFITPLIILLIAASCTNKVPDTVNNIPDHAFIVASVHPQKVYQKGQISELKNITGKIRNDYFRGIAEDPVKSGIDVAEYTFMFVYFIDDEPVIGTTALLKDPEKFQSMMEEIIAGKGVEIVDHKGYSMIIPDSDQGAIAWNEEKVLFLASPESELSSTEWQEELVSLFELEKEEAIMSIVDFKEFTGKMKDMNVWATGDEMKKLIDKYGHMSDVNFDFPMELYNNYSQTFIEFEDGAMYVHAETHFSDDVTKAAEMFLVAKDELNEDLLELAPGNDLLMAMAFSLDLDKMVKMMKNFTPPEMDSVSGKIEQMTGVPGNDILEAMNGDFVIAVNGAEEGAAIPVEILIGIGLDDESLQEKLMGTVDNMADVKQDGDFFMINANGVELYSGIINGVWVITNTPGYKDAVTGSGLEETLRDSKFSEFSNGAMGMYMNLDLSTYPSSLQGIMSSQGAPQSIHTIAETFLYLGVEGSNNESNMTLRTSDNSENSLYSILSLIEESIQNN